jgi:chemotaxis protein methyltransferase CheR
MTSQFTNRTSSADVVLKDDEFFELRDFIVRVSGIFFPDSKRYFIESRLKKRVEQLGFSSFREYVDF